MDMEKLRKELQQREHREILAKNFGPEETNERVEVQLQLTASKREQTKAALEKQMTEKKKRKEDAEKLELNNDLQNINVETAAYHKEN